MKRKITLTIATAALSAATLVAAAIGRRLRRIRLRLLIGTSGEGLGSYAPIERGG